MKRARVVLSTLAITATSILAGGAANALVSPSSSGYFSTLPPGSALPSDSTCASKVRPVPEQRADNAVANATVPAPGSFTLAPLGAQNGYDVHASQLEARVTGNFTGTTDEIIQWASCKWGFDENVVRAIAMTESNWHQSQLGGSSSTKCPPRYAAPCPQTFGIHQDSWNEDPMGTFPAIRNSTAFNLDASLLIHRICYEGDMLWLRDVGFLKYAARDLWGCVGQWYSGGWHDVGAALYIAKVKGYVLTAPWTKLGFSNVKTASTTTLAPATTA